MKKISMSFLLLAILSIMGCGGGIEGTGGPEPERSGVEGSAQKGPFVIGSSVTISYLENDGTVTSDNIQTETSDSLGSFSFVPEKDGAVEIKVKGYHLNEITGNLSTGELTLNAIYNLASEKDQSAFVNILTHLIHNRVQVLMGEGVEVETAISQAQNELLDGLDSVFPKPSGVIFTSLSVYNVDGSDKENNDYLLALSAAIYQYAMLASEQNSSSVDAELSMLLNSISSDLADNGKLDNGEYIENLNQAIAYIDKEEIETNLKEKAVEVTGSEIEVPDIGGFLVGMIITAPADEAAIYDETIVRTLFPESLSLNNGTLLIDGVAVKEGIEDLSEISWNPYFWGDNNRHSIMVKAENDIAGEVISNLISVDVSSSVGQLLVQALPEDGAVYSEINAVEFVWQELSGATDYAVQISTSSTFYSSYIEKHTSDTSVTFTDLYPATFYWRIKASKDTLEGPWSAIRSFEITAPELPKTNTPKVIKREDSYDLDLSWENQGEGNTYTVYLKDLTNKSQEVIEKSTIDNMVNFPELLPGTYVWQIKRINSLGQESETSSEENIKVGVFSRSYGGSNNDEAIKVITSKIEGNIILAKTKSLEVSSAVDSDGDDWIFRIDEAGNIVWQILISHTGESKYKDIIELEDGAVIVSGEDKISKKAIIAKISQEGELVWENTYGEEGKRANYLSITEIDGNIMALEYYSRTIHTVNSKEGNLEKITPIPDVGDIGSYSARKILTSKDETLVVLGKIGTEIIEGDAAYLHIFDKDMNEINSWSDIGLSEQVGAGNMIDMIETVDGRFAIIGSTYMGGGIVMSIVDNNCENHISRTFEGFIYDSAMAYPKSDGSIVGLYSNASVTDSVEDLELVVFNKDLEIERQKYPKDYFWKASNYISFINNSDLTSIIVANESIGETKGIKVIRQRSTIYQNSPED
ncbi:MAG: hypothetical protein D6B27_09810 [Gammaproteobacteria bacterium]|nr:MAG: hypothetical protein D6B27_09810 [Gammaproteobacteria bacterium]